jgi:hypothetical protein
MALQAPDLNQDALSKLEAQKQNPIVQEQRQERVKIARDTIQ